MIVQGSHTFAMFFAHAHMRNVENGEYPSHCTLTPFTQFAQNSTVKCCILWLYRYAQEGYQSSKDTRKTCFLHVCVRVSGMLDRTSTRTVCC